MTKRNELTEPAFTEEMTARVNREGSNHEVLLRGIKGANNIRFGNASGFTNGKRYNVTFTEIPEEEYEPKPTDAEVAAARETLAKAEVITERETVAKASAVTVKELIVDDGKSPNPAK